MTGVGIGVAFVAAVVNAFSVVLRASEASRAPTAEGIGASLLVDLAHRPRWLAGTALVILGGVLQVVALGLAPISAVQPVLATEMLWLLIVARVRLGEDVGRHEVLGALILLGGLVAVLVVAPSHAGLHYRLERLVAPLAVVGGGAIAAYLLGHFGRRATISLVIGAGLSYSWSDFGAKLLAGGVADRRWALAAGWLAGVSAMGAMAFLQENSALQSRPAVTVSPVIHAVKVPLPVLMALWAGAENSGGHPLRFAILLGGLVFVAGGAASLGRSETVARLAAAPEDEGRARHARPP